LPIVFLVANIKRRQGLKILFTLQSNFQFAGQIQTNSGIRLCMFISLYASRVLHAWQALNCHVWGKVVRTLWGHMLEVINLCIMQ